MRLSSPPSPKSPRRRLLPTGFFATLQVLSALALLVGCGAIGEPVDIDDLLTTVDLPSVDGGVAAGDLAVGPVDAGDGCLPGMARINTFCVDRYEGFLVEIDPSGAEKPHSPFHVVGTAKVRAKVAANVYPQAYISQKQATQACQSAGKRLCSAAEFALACRGPDAANYYPYGGTVKRAGYCNEGKGSSMSRFYGNDTSKWTYAAFNDPVLNQWDGGLAPTGSYPKCVSPYGVYDCVGSLHEWGSDAADSNGRGRFRGGFYGDAEYNGHGCKYVTSAHELAYHDYSTGFRCCMDAP